jgi:lysozyme
VSRHQGAIDWGAVGASTSPKIAFAWIKASTGVNAPQPRFATNARGARAAGIPWGGYHWATPAPGDAVAEARDFAKRVQAVAPCTPSIPCALDLEEVSSLRGAALGQWVQAWLDEVEHLLGRRPWVYTGPWYIHGYLRREGVAVLKNEALWVADYAGAVNDTFGWRWKVRQYTSAGRVPGITGKVDMNRFEAMGDWPGFVRG